MLKPKISIKIFGDGFNIKHKLKLILTKLIINKDRTTIPVGTWGTKNENDYEILEFEFPEELENYNKRIVYYLGNERVWDTIVDNKAYLTNAITVKEKVKAYVWLTKENTEREADTDFRTKLFEMKFYDNDNADGIVPTEQQIDGFNTMLTAMNRKIDDIEELRNETEEFRDQTEDMVETARDFISAVTWSKAESNQVDGHLYIIGEESLGNQGFEVNWGVTDRYPDGHLVY